MSKESRTDQVERILSDVDRGDLSVPQGIEALKNRPFQKRGRRTWLPLWLRVALVSEGKGVRLLLPLFVLGPLFLVLFIVLLPFAVLAAALICIRRPEFWRYFTWAILVLLRLTATLLLHGRDSGVWIRDGRSEMGVWLS